MIKKGIFVVIIFLALFSSLDARSYSTPKEIEESGIYFVGWSKEGAIAYVHYYDIGGLCGFCPVYKFVIQSTVTDKEIFNKEIQPQIDANQNVAPLEQIWKDELPTFQNELEKHKIEPIKSNTLQPLSFSHQGSQYRIRVKESRAVKEIHSYDSEGGTYETEVIVDAGLFIDKDAKTKKVYQYKFGSGMRDGLESILAKGFIFSPDMTRIAILVFQSGPGISPPGEYFFVGANLKGGFK